MAPERGAISAPNVRARRLQTLSAVEGLFDPQPIDAVVARTFAVLAAQARRVGRRPKIMDTWIAGTAVTHDLPVYAQDEDFASIPRVQEVRV